MELNIVCYFCHESFDIFLELIDGSSNEIYDCEICCNPNSIQYSIKNKSLVRLEITSAND